MPEVNPVSILQPIDGHISGLKIKNKKKCQNHQKSLGLIAIISTIIVGVICGAAVWFKVQTSPLNTDKTQVITVKITSGSNPSNIAKQLEKESVIRSASAFRIYMKLFANDAVIQAGTYKLSPSNDVAQIVNYLAKGLVSQFKITFYPGATLTDITVAGTPDSKKYDVTTMLKKTGYYSDEEIASALKKTYDSPLFQDKPLAADLEGYVYGETYNFNVGATVEDILKTTFDEYYKAIQANNLVEGFAAHNLNLFEGITLASIIQREASSAADQKQVAQVFYSRMAAGMTLGSDVTYQYIADKTGVERDPLLKSPYNTRLYTGLTPGPISSPGLSALLAVANPAKGDYLYFLSGDDDITYFAYTQTEHETNVADHCKIKCSTN